MIWLFLWRILISWSVKTTSCTNGVSTIFVRGELDAIYIKLLRVMSRWFSSPWGIVNMLVSNSIGSFNLLILSVHRINYIKLILTLRVWDLVVTVYLRRVYSSRSRGTGKRIVEHLLMLRHQISVQIVFLLRKPRTGDIRRRRALPSTCSRPMLSTNRVSWKVAHNHMIIISEFRRCVDPLLNISILTWKLFDFSFQLILHKMFRLILLRCTRCFSWNNARVGTHVLVLKAVLSHLYSLTRAV